MAIFGANSNIARDYVELASKNRQTIFHLYSRKIQETQQWIDTRLLKTTCSSCDYRDFGQCQRYDVIINFIGCGDPSKLQKILTSIFETNETYDRLILDYLIASPSTKYIYLSSGAAHNSSFKKPIGKSSKTVINLDKPENINAYSVAKLTTELKHRTHAELSIVDLRVFNYIRTTKVEEESSLIGNIFDCLLNGKTFKTTTTNIKRDYINTNLFCDVMTCIIKGPNINRGFDLYSKKPVGKLDMINLFAKSYGLKVEFVMSDDNSFNNVTGTKPYYYTTNRDLAFLGYTPELSSLDILKNYANNLILPQGSDG